MNNHEELLKVFEAFKNKAEDFDFKLIPSGHINNTYWVQNKGEQYIFQKMNTYVFPKLNTIVRHIQLINKHLVSKNYAHPTIKLLTFKNGKHLYDNWRVLPYIANSQRFDTVISAEQACQAAGFLSHFHSLILDINLEEFQEVIPGFLDFESRYVHYQLAIKNTSYERLQQASELIQLLNALKYLVEKGVVLQNSLPVRLIHADPKISNFLFNKDNDLKVKALIDWDTFMPGTILYDFGDMVRSYCHLKAEDDDSEGNHFSANYYEQLKKGFLSSLSGHLKEEEIEGMDLMAKLVIYIQSLRFLTDYLNEDKYYTIHYANQNLDRTWSQYYLLKEMLEVL